MLERLAVFVGRHVWLPGTGRVLSGLYPRGRKTRRYVRGIRRRSDGLQMDLDSRNWIDWNVIFRGGFETDVANVLERLTQSGGVAVDIGANIGTHTLTLARRVGPSGRVLAIEPNPATCDALRRNVALNDLNTVVIDGVAVGASEGQISLRVPRQDTPEAANMGLASVIALDTPHDQIDVPMRTLDALLLSHGIHSVDVVKIDVQGYEAAVIAGMSHTLATRTAALVFEFDEWTWSRAKADIRPVHATLVAAGYSLWAIEQRGDDLIVAFGEDHHYSSHCDLVAISAGDHRLRSLKQT